MEQLRIVTWERKRQLSLRVSNLVRGPFYNGIPHIKKKKILEQQKLVLKNLKNKRTQNWVGMELEMDVERVWIKRGI